MYILKSVVNVLGNVSCFAWEGQRKTYITLIDVYHVIGVRQNDTDLERSFYGSPWATPAGYSKFVLTLKGKQEHPYEIVFRVQHSMITAC